MAVTASSVRARSIASLLSAPRALLALGVPALVGLLFGLVARAQAVHVTIAHAVAMGVTVFAHGVLDYLVKPVEPKRLAETVARLQERLRAAEPAHTEHEEVLAFVESRRLMGRGLGWIDLHLLASAVLASLPLCTTDKRLSAVAHDLGLRP